MNIAFIHPSFPGSEGTGATHSATQVIRGLRERGHEVTVFCTRSIPEDIDQTGRELVDLEIEASFPRHFSEELNKTIRAHSDELSEFDLVHSYLMRALPAIGELGRETDVATGVTLNAYLAICPKNDLRYMGEESCNANGIAKCIKCVSDSIRQKAPRYNEPLVEKGVRTPHRWLNSLRQLRQVFHGLEFKDDIDVYRAPSNHVKWNYANFGFETDAIHVIPHPVDDSFRVRHESDFADPHQLLYVGSLEDHKGVDRLVPIVEHLREHSSATFELTIVGTGTLRSKIENQIKKTNLSQHVDIRGFVSYEDLPQLYANSDIFIFPVRWDEPFARVYLEALATGTPIVTTEFGDIGAMLGESSILTDGTAEDFAQQIESAVAENTLPDMSQAAKSQAREYKLSDIITRIETMYTSVVP